MRLSLTASAAALLLALAACGPAEEGSNNNNNNNNNLNSKTDGGVKTDGGTDPNACLNGAENERKVGRRCTKGGGECGGFSISNAWICTVDSSDNQTGSELAFCTKPCSKDSECGSNAVCRGEKPGDTLKGCVPTACE